MPKMSTAGQRKARAAAAIASEFGDDIARIVNDAMPEGSTLREWRDKALGYLGLSGGAQRATSSSRPRPSLTVPFPPRVQRTPSPPPKPLAARPSQLGRTAFATYEKVPYSFANYRTDVIPENANLAARERFSNDPETSWINPEGTDLIFDVMGMEQAPTVRMTGIYNPPVENAPPESNPGFAARVLLGTEGGRLLPGEAESMTGGQAVRAVADVQGGTPWSMPLLGLSPEESGAMFVPTGAPTDVERMVELGRLGKNYNLPDTIDVGEGLIRTNFDFDNPSLSIGELERRSRAPGALAGSNPLIDVKRVMGPGSRGRVVGMTGDYPGFETAWSQPKGSGAVTRQLGDYLLNMPTARREALLFDPRIAEAFGARALRDQAAAKMGIPIGDDIRRSFEIIAEKERLQALFEALRRGLPVMAEGGLVAGDGQR